MHAGGAEARNRGLGHTDPRSQYLIFLDHDDTWEPETLEFLVRALEEHPTAVAAHGLARAIDAEGAVQGDDLEAGLRVREELTESGDVRPLSLSAATTFGAVLVRNWIVTPGMCLIRRSTIQAVGAFEPATSPADDWDLNIRVARHGEVRFVDAVVLNWRRHAGALSNNSSRWRWVCRAVRRRAVSDRGNTLSQRRTALRAVQIDARSSLRQTANDLRHGRIAHAGLEAFYAVLVYSDYARLRFVRR
jgi:GT2 family glycosyltransferase